MTTVISVENLSKSYRLGQIGTGTFSHDLNVWWARMRGKPNPMLRIGETDHGNRDGEVLWALRDVSFTVEQGEVLGIIGRNGAGKSTLLKILSRVTAPTSGRVKVKGRIASLLEVGTGFHPELTGRENIFLNGAILGMDRREIERKFDEIVDFAEIEKFIDTPVKRYSSGMYVRLAFAVAAHLEPEILVVDEVLAVGDAEFQKKCLGKMGDVAHEGRTVLFVSHNMVAISALCPKSILLNGGRLIMSGTTTEIIDRYQEYSLQSISYSQDLINSKHIGNGKAYFSSLEIFPISKEGNTLKQVVTGCDLSFALVFECKEQIKNSTVAIAIYNLNGYPLIHANSAMNGKLINLSPNHKTLIKFIFHDVLLKPGHYTVGLWLGRGGIENIDYIENATLFTVFDTHGTKKHEEESLGIYLCKFDVYTLQTELGIEH